MEVAHCQMCVDLDVFSGSRRGIEGASERPIIRLVSTVLRLAGAQALMDFGCLIGRC